MPLNIEVNEMCHLIVTPVPLFQLIPMRKWPRNGNFRRCGCCFFAAVQYSMQIRTLVTAMNIAIPSLLFDKGFSIRKALRFSYLKYRIKRMNSRHSKTTYLAMRRTIICTSLKYVQLEPRFWRTWNQLSWDSRLTLKQSYLQRSCTCHSFAPCNKDDKNKWTTPPNSIRQRSSCKNSRRVTLSKIL